jgi:radical SAM superfamily enzyme YgiQ (UPF0313 family)
MTYWYTGVKETISVLREYFPTVPILLGGVYASLMPEHALENSGADEIITGPGEWALSRVLFRLTGKHAQVEPDERLGFTPALDLVRRVRFLPILTSRGCPFRCSYCASGRLLSLFLRREPASVVSEIEEGRLRYGASDIALYDDAFLIDAPRHAIPVLESVIERVPGLRCHTPNGLHASAIDGPVASLLKKAGFETIRIGLESSSDQFHAHTGGKTDMSSFLAAVNHLKEAGFSRNQIGVYLLVGLPGQSRAQIEDDVDHVLQAGAVPKLAEYSPLPGTEMWAEAVRCSRFPIDTEPLFQNCTLLPAAEPDVDWDFLQATRKRISEYTY